MITTRFIRLLQAILIGSLAVFGLSLGHVSIDQQSMQGMHSMSKESGLTSIRCQISCSTTVTSKSTVVPPLEIQAKDPLPYFFLLPLASFAFITLLFIVKPLHLLSSWKPPDRTLLCGHYSDGL